MNKYEKVNNTVPAFEKQSGAGKNSIQLQDNRQQAIIQRKIKLNKVTSNSQSGIFSSDNSRPAWRKFLKEYVANDYRQRNGISQKININLNSLKLDRCHKVSFKDIQNWLVQYLNKSMSKSDFINYTNILYSSTSEDKKDMETAREKLFKAGNDAARLNAARALLSLLNSATGNLRLGDSSLNRSIQEQLDLNVITNTQGNQSFSPQSKRILTQIDKGDVNNIALTPKRGNLKSSSAGIVNLNNLTPVSKNLAKKHS